MDTTSRSVHLSAEQGAPPDRGHEPAQAKRSVRLVAAGERHGVRRQRMRSSELEPSTYSVLVASPLLSEGLFQLFFFPADKQIDQGNMDSRDEKRRR
jgi:hypothetical protein